jgi:hypothetical protein
VRALKRHPLRTAGLVALALLVLVGLDLYAGRIPPSGVVWDAYYLYGPDAHWDQAPGPLLASGHPIIDRKDQLKAAIDAMAAQLQAPAGSPGQAQGGLTDLHSVVQLRDRFNQAARSARLILILSPT